MRFLKNFALSTLLAFFCFLHFSEANTRPGHFIEPNTVRTFGAGVMIGEPTGLSAKYWLNGESAVDFGLAFSFDSYALILSDYLFQFPSLFGQSSQFVRELSPYVGVGGVLAISGSKKWSEDRTFYERGDNGVGLGIRIPVGVEWLPARAPIGVFLEVVPGVSIVPRTNGIVQADIGVRYYF